MLELAFQGPGGHVYRAAVRFVQEPDGRILLQELPYSFFWDASGGEVQLARSAAPYAAGPEVVERFRAALAPRAQLREASPPPRSPARSVPAPPPIEDDGSF